MGVACDNIGAMSVRIRSMRRALALAAALMAAGAPAAPNAGEAVDLELILGVDVSRSVDADEARLQRDGYIAAFAHPSVVEAVQSGFLGRIAVMYFEWAAYGHNKIVVDWTLIDGQASAHAFSAKLAEVPLESASRTSISGAIDFAAPIFGANDFDGTRRVIDLSGDGANNLGRLVTSARDEAIAKGLIINGLPIVNGRPSLFGRPSLRNLDLYYVNCVIGGPGAFVIVANGTKDYAKAILRKLILEIAGITPPHRLARAAPPPARATLVADHRVAPPCDVGEQRWRFIDDDY